MVVLNLYQSPIVAIGNFVCQVCGGEFWVKVAGNCVDVAVGELDEVSRCFFEEVAVFEVFNVPDMLADECLVVL
jgi:hypothetical protein